MCGKAPWGPSPVEEAGVSRATAQHTMPRPRAALVSKSTRHPQNASSCKLSWGASEGFKESSQLSRIARSIVFPKGIGEANTEQIPHLSCLVRLGSCENSGKQRNQDPVSSQHLKQPTTHHSRRLCMRTLRMKQANKAVKRCMRVRESYGITAALTDAESTAGTEQK